MRDLDIDTATFNRQFGGIDSSRFDGVWYMDKAASGYRDPETGEWIVEPLQAQTVESLQVGTHTSLQVSVKHDETVTVFMGYECELDDTSWVPYTILGIEGDQDHPSFGGGGVLKSGIHLGKPIAFIKQVYSDPYTQYRITRNLDGSAQYVLMRRVSEDGQRLVGTVLHPDGSLAVNKVLTRFKPADAAPLFRGGDSS